MRFSWILLLLLPSIGLSQDLFSGQWLGSITQNDGGYRPTYSFEMYLNQNGKEVTGRSYVYFDDYFAEMELKGRIKGRTVTFYEVKIVNFEEPEGMVWCMKKGQLRLRGVKKGYRLEGPWQGETQFGPCVPGLILLSKVVPRA
ncbi:MAG: hypothetical protein AAF798_20850 [Bacteroidota bacterium]